MATGFVLLLDYLLLDPGFQFSVHLDPNSYNLSNKEGCKFILYILYYHDYTFYSEWYCAIILLTIKLCTEVQVF